MCKEYKFVDQKNKWCFHWQTDVRIKKKKKNARVTETTGHSLPLMAGHRERCTHMLTLMVELLTVNGILYSTSFWISARLLGNTNTGMRLCSRVFRVMTNVNKVVSVVGILQSRTFFSARINKMCLQQLTYQSYLWVRPLILLTSPWCSCFLTHALICSLTKTKHVWEPHWLANTF